MHRSRSLRSTLAAVLALTALPFLSAVSADAATGGESVTAAPQRPKSLVIGIDGATFATFGKARMPHLKSLMAQGMTATSNYYAQPMAPTSSGPGWSSIATGVWPDKHGVVDNSFDGANYDQYPDYATRVEASSSPLDTLVVGTWSPIPDTVFGPATDTRLRGVDDADTTATAASRLARTRADATFVQLDEVDSAGHHSGAGSQRYLDALSTADAQVGRLLQAVASRADYADENWQIIVTTDHGHTDSGGHGGNTPQERQTFVIAKGSGFSPGSVRHDVKVTDIAPTVLTHLGISVDPAWQLDGRAVSTSVPDSFDPLRSSLRPAVDETGLPSTLKGWTNTAPSGWSIDNSAMPAGGVTEWRGWAFATDEFWTNTQTGQGRETNVRARDVFAVADSDEWDDKAHGAGPFDSTLTSPAFPVQGGATAHVSFVSHYRTDGPQSGDVLVSYDGGAPRPLTSYRTPHHRTEKLSVDVPADVTSLRLHFRYTGTNSAFWTVDQVTVTR
ncbi:alkaline phosphatase family protein [Streptomyces sp. NPDC088789]|uniref:alkaline phosphatase family protein n=1 Tax=Streptomyces sp. NPDC088789 TaxID=3365899 RepID=UPI00382F7C89